MQKILSLFSVFLLLSACEVGVEVPEPSKGQANLSLFVSLGDSYTAGYTNGALSPEGQQTSFASLLAAQIELVSPQDYHIPLLPEETSVGSTLQGEMVLVQGESGPTPYTSQGDPDLLLNPETWINTNGPYQNLGIPGARVFHLLTPAYGNASAGAGNFNPFYARFASSPGLSTALSDAQAQTPSFFSLWIGVYDVLGYALAGGEGQGGVGSQDITPSSLFEQSLDYLLGQLTAEGSKGVVATLPIIEQLPFFNVILPNALVLDATQAAGLLAAYGDYNTAAASYGLSPVTFSEGANFWIVEDDTNPLGLRQIKASEKLLLSLPRENFVTKGWGSQVPIPQEYVLDEAELLSISNAIDDFNGTIAELANKYDLALADLPALMEKTAGGLIIDGVTYNHGYVTGGLFSLDGIHPTGRGSAIIANAFIEAINVTYKSTIPLVDVNSLWGIQFP